MNNKETDYKIDSLGAKCSLLDRTFNDVPRIITEIITEYEYSFSVSCLRNDHIWLYVRTALLGSTISKGN